MIRVVYAGLIAGALATAACRGLIGLDEFSFNSEDGGTNTSADASSGAGGVVASPTGGASGSATAGRGGFSGSVGANTGGAGGASGSAGGGTGGGSGSAGASTGDAGGVITTACEPGTPSCVLVWAGVHGWTGNSSDGVGTAARFGVLSHITADASHVYVTDANAIRRIAIATATVTTLAGALNEPGNVDSPGADARFGWLSGITTDGVNVWVADRTNLRIRVVTIATGAVNTLALTTVPASGLTQYDLGPYLYYVTDAIESSLYQVNKTTGETTQLVGAAGPGLTDANASLAQLNRPRAVFAVGDGQLMIGDTENHRIRGYDSAVAAVTTFAGTIEGYFDAPRASAQFRRLRGIHVHQAATAMYIADSNNFAIRRLNLTTQYVSTIAGTAAVAGHRDGIGTYAQFDNPVDVYYHTGVNDLFILEDSVIRRMYTP